MGIRFALLFHLMLLSGVDGSGLLRATPGNPVLPELQGTIENLNQRTHLVHKIYKQLEESGNFAVSEVSLLPMDAKDFPFSLKQSIEHTNAQYQLFSNMLAKYHKHPDPELLREISLCVEDLDVLQQKISFEVEIIWKAQDFPHGAESDLLMLNRKLIKGGLGVLAAMRGGLKSEFRRNTDSTEMFYSKWQEEAWHLYSQLPSLTRKAIKAPLEKLEQQWAILLLACNNFEAMKLPEGYETANKANYFYNHHLLAIMALDANSLVNLHNELLSKLGSPFPPVLTRMPWIQAPEAMKEELPKHFIVVVDGSASMSKALRMESFKHFLPRWVAAAEGSSRFSLIAWEDEGPRVILKHSQSQAKLVQASQGIHPKGELHGYQGIESAYQLPPLPGYEIQVLLITDGGLPITPALAQLVGDAAYKGQHLNVAYMGPKERESKLNSISKLGKGDFFNLSIDSDREEIKLFFGQGVF